MRVAQIPWEYDESKIIRTTSYEATQSWIEEVMSAPGLYVLLGPPGVGKTYGAVAYAKRHRVPYINPPVDKDNTVRKFWRYVATHVCDDYDSAIQDPFHAMYMWCETHPQPRLIIDEAVRLRRAHLDALRDLTDRYPASILLIGTSELERKLQMYDTVVHRVAGIWRVPQLTVHDIKVLFEISNEVAESVYNVTGGNLRHLQRLAERLNEIGTVTPGVVKQIAAMHIMTHAAHKEGGTQ